jgi:hypothetical protein
MKLTVAFAARSFSAARYVAGMSDGWVADTQRERRTAGSHQRLFKPETLTAMTPWHTVSEAHRILIP